MRLIFSVALFSLVFVGCSKEPVAVSINTTPPSWEVQAKLDAERDQKRRESVAKKERDAKAEIARLARKKAWEADAPRREAQRALEEKTAEIARRQKATISAKMRREKTEAAREANKPSTDQVLYAGRKFVKASLKSPSTADFGGWFGNGTGLDHGDGIYTAKMWVDSQNSFGALVRTQCWVKMRHKSGSNFDLIQLSTD